MQRWGRTWGCLSIVPALVAFQAATPSLNPLNGIELRSIEVSDLNSDRVRFQLHLGGIAQEDIALRALSFDSATVNGIPVFLPPISARFRLSKGQEFRAIGALQAELYFRDLDSLTPLRRMVQDKKADVRATIRLQPDLSLLQRMVLRASGAWVSTTFERSVGVEVPGGMVGRGAALMALAAADSLWVLGRSGLEWRNQRDAFVQQVRATYAPRVLVIETRYQVRGKDGRQALLTWRGLGFHQSGGQVIVPAEAIEPWLFDSTVADAIASGAAEVIKSSLDIVARMTTGTSYSLRNGNLKIVRVAQDRSKAISVRRRKVYEVRERNSTANVAKLLITSSLLSKLREATANGAAQTVAVFRLRDSAAEQWPEILILSATGENGTTRLVEPVDLRASGSPVINQDGMVGILLDQSTIASMQAIREKLGDVE